MGLLTRTQIDGAADLETVDVPCPEWGGDVRLRALDGHGRSAWIASVAVEDAAARHTNVLARLVALSAVDAAGNLLYPGAEGAAALGKRSGAVLDRLFDAAQKLSKLNKSAVDATEKNSGATPNVASSSDSASPLGASLTPTSCYAG